MHVFNSALNACSNGGTQDRDDCESRAFAEANGVVKQGKAKHSMPKPANDDVVASAVIPEEEDWITDKEVAFKKLSYQARKDLPKTAYAYTDSQGKGHLPINDLDHLRNAISRLGQKKTGAKWGLTGEAKKRLQARLQAKLERASHAREEAVAEELASFAIDASSAELVEVPQDKDVVIRRGLIFRAGDYPDKQFNLTPKELRRAVKSFADPIALDSEHGHSIFDGKLGHLVGVEASDDGSQLFGVVAVPKWLDPILQQAGGKVSAAFDRASKTLVGLALTINPRVSDAALMAAFSVDLAVKGALDVKDVIAMAGTDGKKKKKKFDPDHDGDDDSTPEGDTDHDYWTKSGKKRSKPIKDDKSDDKDDDDDDAKHSGGGYDRMIPKGGSAAQSGGAKVAAMAGTNSGRGMMQAIHDITASRGAVCHDEPQPATSVGPYGIVRYASQAEMSVVQTIHDTTLQHGASCTPSLYGQQDVPGGSPWTWQYPGTTNEGRSSMPGETKAPHFSNSEKAMKQFQKLLDSLGDVDPRYETKPAQMSASAVAAPESRERDEEVARLREENRQMKMQHIIDRATVFADKMIQEGHATPVEREGLIAVHSQLEHDDTFSTTAVFSNGMSRVSAYEASILARPNNLLQAELLPSAVQQGLIKFANMTDTPSRTQEAAAPSADRIRHLASLDPVLKKAYSDTHGTNGTSR